MPQENAWDLGGGGENFAYERIGDEVEGTVIDMVTRQGTDMQTNEPDFWDKEKTRPVMLTLLTLQTTLKDNPKDSGLRTITLAGGKKPYPDGTKSRMCAARTAVLEATGSTAMQPGGWFKMRFSGEGARTKPGFNPPKAFEAWYRAPKLDLDGQDRTPPVNQMSEPAPGANWPSAGTPTTSSPTAGVLTTAQVEGVRALGVDPAKVFGNDWQSRVAG